MKKMFRWAMVVMLTTAPMLFTSCDDDDDNLTNAQIISFENQTVNDDGYWIGTTNEKGYDAGYGTMSYPNTYTEGMLTINTTYSESSYGNFWSGFAVSSRKENTFTNLYPDQFNNIVGKAYSGNKFCVVTTYGESMEINGTEGAEINGFAYTNASYTVNSIVNGDSYATPFEEGDYLICTVTGTHPDNTTATVDIVLADYRYTDAADRYYVNTWKYVDLTSLGKVIRLDFSFRGSKNNEYGLLTPAYICIDNVVIKKP